ncbi:hypothetical protein BDZ90DRAFT_84005 [Jaminaea rosea]|uniref:Protein YOP1 n=1 Tax=Jaminaea rosea TaxID=1569628 RepID=A0A316UMR4_9BASI|nr:hypothetical protein BDZ90DRAFT_84005 [Jaminaea rosea]PWN25213.1 hypothetical protein BDZ90DRAFT_84005 [Jaminaea rosea]
MSLLNAGLKLAISAINLIDVFKALTASGSKSATAPSFSELGRATSTTHRLVRDAVGTPSRQPHTRYRIGSTQRRQQLRLALSLVVVWTLYQSVEPVLDAIASYIVPFYSTLKTAFLLWLFFARTGASMRIISTLINPVLAPYQVLIDAIISSTLNLFFNLTFLASLPISWGLLYVRRSTGRVVNWARLWMPWREAKIEDSPSKSVRNGDGSPRMPPPSLSTRRRPRPSSDGSPSLSAPTQRHRTASLGMGRPAQLAPHSSARSVSSSSGSSRPTAPSAATMKALQDLPPAPTGFFTTSQAGDGSFAFIPGGQKEETEDASLPAALDPFTPSILPGGFGLSNVVGKKRGPLKMPAAAKARNSKAASRCEESCSERSEAGG